MLYIKDNKIICKNTNNIREYDLTVNKSYSIINPSINGLQILDDEYYPAYFNYDNILENFYTTDEIRLLKLNSL
jgi:hypothetical protein